MRYLFIGTTLMATGIVFFLKGPWTTNDVSKIPPPNPVPPLWNVVGDEADDEDSEPEKKRPVNPLGPQGAAMISVPPR